MNLFELNFCFIFIDIKEQVRTIEKAVNSKEPRLILRVLRGLATTRKRLNEDVLRRLILFYYNSLPVERDILLSFLHANIQVNSIDFNWFFDEKKISFFVLGDGRRHGKSHCVTSTCQHRETKFVTTSNISNKSCVSARSRSLHSFDRSSLLNRSKFVEKCSKLHATRQNKTIPKNFFSFFLGSRLRTTFSR